MKEEYRYVKYSVDQFFSFFKISTLYVIAYVLILKRTLFFLQVQGINPMQQVPVLVINGATLTQSVSQERERERERKFFFNVPFECHSLCTHEYNNTFIYRYPL
jgi:hypothetical protein